MLYLNRFIFAIAFALLFPVLPSSAQNAQLSVEAEAAIVADLESGDASLIMQALDALPSPYEDSLYKEKISHRMALALIEASERQTDLFFNPPEGYDSEDHGHEFASELSHYVVPLRIPEAIPALLKASQFGNPAINALADFGPDIVYAIIEYLEDSERTYREIMAGFFALERTIYTHQPLDPAIRSAAKEITVRQLEKAEEYYSGPDGSTAGIITAISVAQVLGDPDLKQMVLDILPLEEERNLRFNGMGTNWAQYILDTWDEVQRESIDQND